MTIVTLASLVTSCGDKGSGDINVAFQSEEDGRWGMMTTSGKVIFEDEFERKPSASVNGYFRVKNADDLWEIYSAEKKPRQVGGEYLYVGPFADGVAPVVEKGKPVTLIDTDGKVVTTLDKLSGKTVKAVQAVFTDGSAVFEIEAEELYGLVSSDGKVLIEPEYPALRLGGDLVLGVSKKTHDKMVKDDADMPDEIIVFNLKGKEQSRINLKKNDITQIEACSEGLLKVQTGSGSSRKTGLMNKKGEWVVKPSSKVKDIGEVMDKTFVYYDGERYGLMNFDGEVLIRAKYDWLIFITKKVLAAVDLKNSDTEVKLIFRDGEEASNETWETLYGLGDGNIMARENSNSWVIINPKGETVSDKNLDIYSFNATFCDKDEWVESDYLDIAALLSKLSITKDGILGIKLHSGAEAALKALFPDDETDRDPENYTFRSSVSCRKMLSETSATVEVYFDNILSTGVLGTKTETDWYGNPYTYETVVGYKWSSAKARMVCAQIYSGGKMGGKESEVYQFLAAQTANFGKVTKQGKTFTVVSLGKDESLLVVDGGSNGVGIAYIAVPATAFNDLNDDNISYGGGISDVGSMLVTEEEEVVDSVAYEEVDAMAY